MDTDVSQGPTGDIGGAMLEAMANMSSTKMRVDPLRRAPAAPAAPMAVTPQQLTDIMRETFKGAVKEATADITAQMRGQTEAAEVARANLQDLQAREAEKAKRIKHASVSSFDVLKRKPQVTTGSPEQRMDADERVLAAMTSDRLIRGFTFLNYVDGKSNQFTCKLCKAVAANPGGEFNPFFLYGDVGLGKTHLINAIGTALFERDPDLRTGYVSSSRFASRLADAIRDQAVDVFRQNYCHWDMLILDDIQFLGGRVEAQEEFFHIFNVLQEQGRQIIIAGDRSPDRLGLLEQRLVSRFDGGIVASVKPPEWEARMVILKQQLKQGKTRVSDEVLSLIATRVTNDVRKMNGSLRKIVAYAELVGANVTCEMATEILSHLGVEEAA